MSEGRVRAAIAVLSLAGAAVSGYLVYARYVGATISCTTGGCETVQASEYSELLGVPVAVLGLVAYALVLATALARGEAARTAGMTLSLAAVGFSTYLLYVQAALVEAFCDWCLASDAIVTVVAALSLLRVRAAAVRPQVRGGPA